MLKKVQIQKYKNTTFKKLNTIKHRYIPKNTRRVVTEAYLEPSRISTMERFCENS